jgi:hypothetical protein
MGASTRAGPVSALRGAAGLEPVAIGADGGGGHGHVPGPFPAPGGRGEALFQEAGVEIARLEGRMVQHARQ